MLQELPYNVKEIYITTSDKKRLQCFYVENPSSDKLVIYFHGNAGNIYNRISELIRLSQSGANVLGVGYRGYGKSTGRPSERGIYKDGLAAISYALDSLKYDLGRIFVFGRSLGTTVAIQIGSQSNPAGIILVTPLTTGKEYGKAHGFGVLSSLAGNAFNSLLACTSIRSPVLIIHGTDDEVIPFWMGKRIFETLHSPKRFIEISGGLHNSLEFNDPALYWSSIEDFISNSGS